LNGGSVEMSWASFWIRRFAIEQLDRNCPGIGDRLTNYSQKIETIQFLLSHFQRKYKYKKWEAISWTVKSVRLKKIDDVELILWIVLGSFSKDKHKSVSISLHSDEICLKTFWELSQVKAFHVPIFIPTRGGPSFPLLWNS
jgi:hypothetical protein